MPNNLGKLTNKKPDKVSLSTDEISKLINNLDPNKTLSHWKNAHVVPVHKKGDKQCLKNYRPISLLPACR